MKINHVDGESFNLVNTSQVVPGESFPTNAEIGKANQINTFKQVHKEDHNHDDRFKMFVANIVGNAVR